jgi:uncharacterized protein YndB with AHSA1/START domain
MTEKPEAVHIIHIAASAQKTWDAITNSDLSPSYFFGNRFEFGGKGGDFRVIQPDGQVNSQGRVLVRDEPHVLRVTWDVVIYPDMRAETPGEVEFRLEDLGGVTRLTVSEFNRPPGAHRFEDSAREGWSLILSGIKSIVETGAPMPRVQPKGPEQ